MPSGSRKGRSRSQRIFIRTIRNLKNQLIGRVVNIRNISNISRGDTIAFGNKGIIRGEGITTKPACQC